MSAKGSSGVPGHPTLTDQALTIEGDAIPVEHRRMPLKDVRLDPSNPRIRHAVKQKSKNGHISDEDLRKLILDQPGVSQLFTSIRDNGGIFDPIYVHPDGSIIEGNCRAACYMRLHTTYPTDDRWQNIPAVFVLKITDRQVAILQGQYHVAGKNKWRAYEKVGQLHHMHTVLKMDEKSIAKALGLRESDVVRDLTAYKTMTDKLLPKMTSSNGLEKWSFIQEFYKRKALEGYRSKPENIDEFISLIVDKKLKQGSDVRKLEEIIKHSNAVKSLKKDGIDKALSVVGKVDPTVDSRAFKKLKEATTILQHLENKELARLQDEKARRILQDLFAAVKNVAKAAGVKLS
jgi:hypothetical protein